MPEWTFKDDAATQGSSDGFWYDINNGYIKPAEVLSDPDQLAKLTAAIETVASFEGAIHGAGLIEDC